MKHIELKTVCLAAVMLLAGCVKEAEVKTNDTRGDVTVRMNLNVPGHVVTRGLSVAQEDAVRTIDLLVFDKDLELIDLRHGEILNKRGELSLLATIRASKDAQDVFRLMVLANVRGTLHNILGDGDDLGGHKGKSYSAMVGILEAAVSDYPHILRNGLPMWGEPKDPLLLMPGEITIDEPLDMLRSLARIDVGTNPTPAFAANGKITGWDALPNFSLEEVHVYNANTHYALSARTAYNFTGGAAGTVNGYTLPSTAGKHSDELPYSDTEQGDGTVLRATDGKGIALTGSIYAGEANVKMGGAYGDANHTDRMALVVGGRYSRDTARPNTTGEMSYYRLDFTSGTAAALMDIMRNRDYQIVITSCSGPGKPTPDEAFETVKVDMTAIVRAWDTEYENDFDFDGQYYLRVNRSRFYFDNERTQTLEVETDYPGDDVPISYPAGWKVAKIEYLSGGTGWITSPTTSTTGGTGKTQVDITVTENPSKTSERSAKITIKAGNMSKVITVVQKKGFATYLTVTSPMTSEKKDYLEWNDSGRGVDIRFNVNADGPWEVSAVVYENAEETDFRIYTTRSSLQLYHGSVSVLPKTENDRRPVATTPQKERRIILTITAPGATAPEAAPKTVTIVQRTKTFRAVRGMIGYIWNPGGDNHMQLTLDGDKDFITAGSYTGSVSTQSQYTVYAALFKFGSLVATNSRYGLPHFSPDDIVAWPTEWAATTDYRTDRTAMEAKFSGATTYSEIKSRIPTVNDSGYDFSVIDEGYAQFPSPSFPANEALAIGDPCTYYFGNSWRAPTMADIKADFFQPGAGNGYAIADSGLSYDGLVYYKALARGLEGHRSAGAFPQHPDGSVYLPYVQRGGIVTDVAADYGTSTIRGGWYYSNDPDELFYLVSGVSLSFDDRSAGFGSIVTSNAGIEIPYRCVRND